MYLGVLYKPGFAYLRIPPSQNMYPFEQRKINFPHEIFQKFFYEKIPEWCPEGTGITTSLHAYWFIVLGRVKFSNTQKCSTPLIFLDFFFAKILQPLAEGTEVSRALYLLLILWKSWFFGADVPKIDAKSDEKVEKS